MQEERVVFCGNRPEYTELGRIGPNWGEIGCSRLIDRSSYRVIEKELSGIECRANKRRKKAK